MKFYENGKYHIDIARENRIILLALVCWNKNHQEISLRNDRTEVENKLTHLRKEKQRLLMENDILKQEAVMMGRK